MKVRLTNGYYITQDNYNYILMQDYESIGRKDKRPKTMTRTVGYYSKGIKGLKGCIKRYLEDSSLDEEKSADGYFESFCEDMMAVISNNADWIMEHIEECIEHDRRGAHNDKH